MIGSSGYPKIAMMWLVSASLFFYAWWNLAYLWLILISILINYTVGVFLAKNPKRCILVFGLIVNLALLGYFKYANFFIDNLNTFINTNIFLESVVLPLAISFFTFQQVAYLVDVYRGEIIENRFLNYTLFVVFFPQLIAGPIVHHKEMLPQFLQSTLFRLKFRHLAVGITIFAIGLFKKVVLADGLAIYATPVFNAAEYGVTLTFFEAWGGVLAYTLQIYFDFSGYSDMAIGIARMFGIRLPLNFSSPYKATSIIQFWRCWHITLSRFMRDYIYIPLGGSRKSESRRNLNIIVTMLLGGLWHGAGWTFILWGGLHGFYIAVNHLWRKIYHRSKVTYKAKFFGWMLTMLAVVISWVLFRAETLGGAIQLFSAMIGLNGFMLPETYLNYLNYLFGLGDFLLSKNWVFGKMEYFHGIEQFGEIVLLIMYVTLLPNTQQILWNYHPAFETYRGEVLRSSYSYFEWHPTSLWAIFSTLILFISILAITRVSEFLYFQF